MKVYIPTPLRSYTQHQGEVLCEGRTVAEALAHLDRQYPGIRFRIVSEQDAIREHIKVFVNEQAADLTTPLQDTDELHVICALSGG